MNIDRCICTGITFAQALEQGTRKGWGLEELRRELGVGGNCGLCRPYLKRALATGETVFHEIITERP